MSSPSLSGRLRAALADRSRLRRWALELLLFAAVIAGIHLWQVRDLPGGPAPALAGPLSDGRTTSLAQVIEAAAGRPVLVVFWSAWCPVCKAEEGNIAAVARDWPLLSVAMQSGDAAAVAKHLKERGLEFTALVDGAGWLAREWNVRGVPTHFIVDGRGIIRFRVVGYATEFGLRARLWWAGAFAT